MDRIDTPSATPDRQFTEGSPAGGVPATTVKADWLNDLQEEMMTILAEAGITPAKGVQNQILTALQSLFGGPGSATMVASTSGHVSLPVKVAGVDRAFILQWMQVTVNHPNSSANFTLPTTFPNAGLGAVCSYISGIGAATGRCGGNIQSTSQVRVSSYVPSISTPEQVAVFALGY